MANGFHFIYQFQLTGNFMEYSIQSKPHQL